VKLSANDLYKDLYALSCILHADMPSGRIIHCVVHGRA
jgi:hypothetical protein